MIAACECVDRLAIGERAAAPDKELQLMECGVGQQG